MKKSIIIGITLLCFSQLALAADLSALVSSGAGLVGKRGKIDLTISGGYAPYSILWTGPSGFSATDANLDSLAPGTYCVTVKDKYCGEAKLCLEVTAQSSEVSEIAGNKTLEFYPNPFAHRLNIKLTAIPRGEPISLLLQDQLGRTIAQKNMLASELVAWELAEAIPNGMYLITVVANNGQRFIGRIYHSAY